MDKKPGAKFKRIDPVDAIIDAHALMLLSTGGEAALDVDNEVENYLKLMGWS